MKEKVFEVLDALYEFMNPALRYPNKEKWKEDTLERLSGKTDAEVEEWVQNMWDIINYKE